MNVDTARKINAAAVMAWYFKAGLTAQLSYEQINLIKSTTIAQIQTAGEVVEALNRDALLIDGKRTITCVVASESVPGLKQYVDALRHPADELP